MKTYLLTVLLFGGIYFISFKRLNFIFDLTKKQNICIISIVVYNLWARSSAGRAPRSQRGGREFDPLRVHHEKHNIVELYSRVVFFSFVCNIFHLLLIANRVKIIMCNSDHYSIDNEEYIVYY